MSLVLLADVAVTLAVAVEVVVEGRIAWASTSDETLTAIAMTSRSTETVGEDGNDSIVHM